MALLTAKPKDIPSDAIRLTEDEALQYQWKLITGWNNFKDVWALKYSAGVIGGMSALSAIYVNSYYRGKFKLGTYGRFSTYLPIVVLPSMLSMLGHKLFVQRQTLLNPLGECPLCMQLRAATIQMGLGVAYPTLMAPLAASMFAIRHFTYDVPSITEQPLKTLQLWRKMSRPLFPVLTTMVVSQALIAMYLTYKQAKQNLELRMKLLKMESEMEENIGMDLANTY